jgi:hypothetical protein
MKKKRTHHDQCMLFLFVYMATMNNNKSLIVADGLMAEAR